MSRKDLVFKRRFFFDFKYNKLKPLVKLKLFEKKSNKKEYYNTSLEFNRVYCETSDFFMCLGKGVSLQISGTDLQIVANDLRNVA